jgi:hypothetical protein
VKKSKRLDSANKAYQDHRHEKAKAKQTKPAERHLKHAMRRTSKKEK